MNNVLDVCRYIINYSNKRKYGISNLKLQKVLYFVQAFFLINKKNNEPCFAEPIEAWEFGPVVPIAYREYKRFGSTDIPTVDSYIKVDPFNLWNLSIINFNEECLPEKDRILIENVVDQLSDFSATDLVKITQNQNLWIESYSEGLNNEIKVQSMINYFNQIIDN